MNKKPLLTVIAAVVIVCIAGLVGTAAYLRHRHGGAGARTERLPHDTAMVFTVDVAQARAWPEMVSLHNWLSNPGPDASPGVHDASQRYRDLTTGCGFDPWQKVDAFTLGVDRSVFNRQSESDVVSYVDGTFTPDQARHCIDGVAAQSHRTLQPEEVAHHPVLTFPRPTDATHSQQVAVLDHSVLLADQSYMARALAIFDGTTPGMPATSPLAAMLGHLGGRNIVNFGVDMAAIRAHNAQGIDNVIDALAHDNPSIQYLDVLKQVTLLGVGLQPVSPTQALVMRFELPDATLATHLTTALNAFEQARRGDLLRALDQGQATLGMVQATSSLGGGEDMSRQATQVNAGINALRQMLQQVHVTTDGTASVVTLTFTPQQVTALDGAVRAMADILAGVSRSVPGMRGLGVAPPGALGGGGGSNGSPGVGLPGLGL